MNILLLMNPQNSFLSKTGSVYMGEKAEILIIRLQDYLSKFTGKKVFFREKHAMQDEFFVTDRTHSVATTNDYKVHEFLNSYATVFVDKTRYCGFYNTELESFLKREQVKSVKMAGVETHTSILFTAEELRNRGYDVEVIEPCTMSRDDYMHDYAITLMRNALGIKIGG